MNVIKDLGCITNVEVIKQFVSLGGKLVVDAGCASMIFTRHLSDLGARVLAIDPDPVQAALNRSADPIPNVEFIETSAQKLPVPSGSVDGVFFAYSLHHIPQEVYPDLFEEVRRVLNPNGFLYVIEPTDCPLNQVMKLFYDEDREREEAQLALQRFAVPYFNSVDIVTHHGYSEYESFEMFADRFSKQSFNSIYSDADVRRPEVKEAFERLGGPEHRFQSPKQVMVLQGLKDP